VNEIPEESPAQPESGATLPGLAARYFDGQRARALPAWLRVHEGQLEIAWDGGWRREGPARLVVVHSQGRAPVRIRLPEGALGELANVAAAAALLQRLEIRRGRVERLEAHAPTVAALLGVFVLILVAIYFWGLPWATDRIADHFPEARERQLGSALLVQLDQAGMFKDTQLTPEKQDEIRRDFKELNRGEALPAYWIVFRRMGVPNALALPGGSIVVSDEIVALAGEDPDALRTVLAHELGHVHYRHGIRNLVHASLVSAWIAWLVGDVSGLVASVGAGFADLHYSRGAESQADRYAWALMHRHGRSTHAAAQLFRRLSEPGAPKKQDESVTARVPVYMSTHPDLAERIALFDSDQAAGEP
jgi:Zn-dependent protease with chaperone function